MSLTSEQMQAIKLDALGGEVAAQRWGEALNALHAYAQASGCPAGHSVYAWYDNRSARYQAAMSEAIQASGKHGTNEPAKHNGTNQNKTSTPLREGE